ncbi:unnamed protein product [Symbiodinium sp. CCMP2456]|nr:unnamed protein product [Symbiodinium sp. CCMP2456]
MKKNAYMRFTRSLTSPYTPQAVLDAYDKCKDNTGRVNRCKVNELFKQYTDSNEKWGESDLVMTAEARTAQRSHVQRRWMLRSDWVLKNVFSIFGHIYTYYIYTHIYIYIYMVAASYYYLLPAGPDAEVQQ